MVGLAQDFDRSADRVNRFHEQLALYRKRLRSAVADAGSLTLEQEDALAYELERDLDTLLMQAANLAREPLVRHMAEAMKHAVALVPNPMMIYPKGQSDV